MVDCSGQRQYRSLRTLPGSNGGYFLALLEIVTWVAARGTPTEDETFSWMRTNCRLPTASEEPQRSVQVVRRMGYLESRKYAPGTVVLTDRGHQLVETRSRELVLGYLLCECERMYDVLATAHRLGTATGENVWNELRFEHQSPDGTPPKPDFYRFRLDWLASLGALAEGDEGFSMTSMGRQALAEYAGKRPIPK